MRKFFSLIAAVLFAGSMMAADATMTAGTNGSAAEVNGNAAIKVGTSKAGGDMTITVGEGATSLTFYAAAWNNVTGLSLNITAPDGVTVTPASVALTMDPGISNNSPFTLTGDEENFKFEFVLAGVEAETTLKLEGSTAKRFVVWGATYETGEVPPTPADTYTVAGNDAAIFGTSWDVTNTSNDMVKAAGIYKWEKAELNLTAGTIIAFKVAKNHSWDVAYPAQNDTVTIAEEGEYTLTITFDPATETVAAEAVKKEALPDPTNCAEAAEAALSVENNNDLYNDGKVYTIEGYVTSIATAYSDSYHNISFWMADERDGGNVLQAYRAACESADAAPGIGDKVAVTGKLTKYNTTPEFAQGCTFVITEKSPVVPQNLGEKTIAEFLELKNMVDTCILTGIVANVKNTQFGNFDLVEIDSAEVSVYVYGLLTAAGEAKKCFEEENIAEGDTLKVLAIYSEYNAAPQIKNAIFVEVKHLPVIADTIDVTINSNTTPGALVWTDAVASAGWWQIMGATEDYEFSLSNVSTTEVAGVYAIDDLDPDYSYITVMTATDTTDVTFVDGSVTVAVANDGTVTIVGALVGDDGNVYNFNLTYADPKAERVANVTISNGTLYDGYASAGLYAVYGTADDNTAYVQLAIWADTFSGDFTEEDLDFQYVGSGVQDADGSHSIFSAAITVTPGNGEGVYSITADLLCYNNTLYKVTMKIGEVQGINNVEDAVKAIKSIMNGQLVIEKNGKTFNAAGQMLK